MRIKVGAAAIVGTALMATGALADPLDRGTSNRHQLTACMTKRMSASRTVSYNEAAKLCKDQLKAPAASTAPLVSNSAAKPVSGLAR